MVNLGNGETKNFAELWKFIHLKIWNHFSIRQTKLFWIDLKHYSQRPLTLSLSKQIPLQPLLSSKWKKAHLNQPLMNCFCKKAPP